MRRGLWKSGILLVAVAMVMGGLAGCSRPAAVREGGSPTDETSSGEDSAAEPGQTVVSAVTSTPTAVMVAVDEQPTKVFVEQPAVTATATPEPPTTEASESASVTEEQTEVHIVQQGETLTVIAEQYGTSVKALRASNDLDTDVIVTGQKLTIPASSESTTDSTADSTAQSTKETTKESSSKSSSGCRYDHKVKKGEWVWQIARDYGVSPYKILKANNLTIKKAKIIRPGKVLCIP